MPILSRPRRPARAGEWTEARAVTYIVTLAATGSVTLAARSVGISRRSAYALKARDPVFAAAWNQALAAYRREKIEGNEVCEVNDPRIRHPEGNNLRPRSVAEWLDARLKYNRRDSRWPARLAGPHPLA